jgi:hypothetical protein
VAAAKKLNRTTFQTSREMDFFSERELVTQTGHEIREWPLVVVKELLDNAIDAAEEADIAPVIDVIADPSGITVRDNGRGLPEKTLAGALNFSVRASSREAYVSPCRGAQGNALKTLFPMPRVIDPEAGKFIVVAHGKKHVITCGCDAVSQRAVVHDEVSDVPKSKNSQVNGDTSDLAFSSGTTMRMEWSPCTDDGEVLWPFGDDLYPKGGSGPFSFPSRFRELVEGYALFNPHLTLRLDWFGEKKVWLATDPGWKKWKPFHPTPAHWYEQRHLERLVGACITDDRDHGQDRLVSEFIADVFHGLSGSAKRTKVLDQAGLKRARLSSLVVDGRLDSYRIAKLLSAMQDHSRPVKSLQLGIIGEDHFRSRLLAMGIVEKSFHYSGKLAKSKKPSSEESDGPSSLPWVLETVFGYRGADAKDHRRIFTGANWSAAIRNPFRSFGSTGEGLETALSEVRATSNEPVVFAMHLAHPRIEYTDRGKSALIIGENHDDHR